MFFFVGISSTSAQSQITAYNDFISGSSSDRARVIALANDIQPAVYVENGEMNVYGDAPVCLYTDLASLQTIETHKVPQAAIEMVILRVASAKELQQKIDYSIFSNYPKLKYIYILSSIDMTEAAIQKLAKGNINYVIIYHSARQS